MPRSRRLVMLACALAFASPASAVAQSAGDEQYEDPFAPETEQSEATPTPAPAPASGGESSAAPAPAPTAEPAPTATAAQQLPYTGADAGILLAGGVALLAGGVALRLRTR